MPICKDNRIEYHIFASFNLEVFSHWWGISCSRRNQSQPPHCGKKKAIRKTDVHFNRRAEQHSRRLAESRVPSGRRNQPQIRGGWRNLAFPADGGISHKSAAAGGNHFCTRDAPPVHFHSYHTVVSKKLGQQKTAARSSLGMAVQLWPGQGSKFLKFRCGRFW